MTTRSLPGCVFFLLSFAVAACSSDGGAPAATEGHPSGGSAGQAASGGAGSGGTVNAGGAGAGGTTTSGGNGGGSAGGKPGGNTGGNSGGSAGAITGGSGGTGAGGTTGGTGVGGTAGGKGGATGGNGGGAGGGGTGETAGAGGTRTDGGVDSGTDSGSAGAGGFSPCPAGAPCAILPLGDSITEGFGSSGGGYRVELFRQAVSDGKNITFVGSLTNGPATVANQNFPNHHEGHGGYTIDNSTGSNGIGGTITNAALSNYKPNIVLLMIGTNDINGNKDIANAPTRLGKLINDIATGAPSALVVVASIIPIANTGTNQKVQTYNAAVVGVVNKAAEGGKHVKFLDNYAAFSKDPAYQTKWMYDYLHPNDAGYVVLGQAFYGAISSVLPAK